MMVVLMKLNNYQLYLVFLYNKVYIKELKGKVSKIYRGGGLCAVFLGGVDHFKNLRGGVTRWQKDLGSQFLLQEGFRSFSRSALQGPN